jgi:uncharacterized heparinase superfamily protein
MVFVKTAVYHAVGTLMPYPSEDPPRFLGRLLLIDRCSISALRFFPLREGSIHSISGDHEVMARQMAWSPHHIAAADVRQ